MSRVVRSCAFTALISVLFVLPGWASDTAAAFDAMVELTVLDATPESGQVECDLHFLQAGSESPAVSVAFLAPGKVFERLSASQEWLAIIDCPGFWAPRMRVDHYNPSVTRELFPLGSLSGSLALQKGQDAPTELAVRFQIAEGSESGTPSRFDDLSEPLECALDESRQFSCPVPSGLSLDGRIEAAGYSSSYFWNLVLDPRTNRSLGTIRLSPGASVVGWIDSTMAPHDRDQEDAQPVISLEPLNFSGWIGDPAEKSRRSVISRGTRADERGFFQLIDANPGPYRLQVEMDGMSKAGVQVDLKEGQELLLDPIQLEPRVSFDLYVDPPTFADGSPWSVRLKPAVQGRQQPPPTLESAVGLDGSLHAADLDTGRHVLEIKDDYGSTWYKQEIEITWPEEPHMVNLDLVEVEGHLSIGDDRPVAGEVFIGTRARRPNFPMSTDEEGYFQGYVSKEGLWPVDVILNSRQRIRPEPVEISRVGGAGSAKVDIRLPDTVMSGTVVSGGEPVSEAFVVAVENWHEGEDGQELLSAVAVGEDGQFEILGAEPGAVRLQAYDDKRKSAWMDVQLVEGRDHNDLRLELVDTYLVRGRVSAQHGPSPGAVVLGNLMLPEPSLPLALPQVPVLADGYFELDVDHRAVAIDLMAIVPGCGIEVARFPTAKGAPPEIELSCLPPRGTLHLTGSPKSTHVLRLRGVDVSVKRLLSVLIGSGQDPWDSTGIALEGLAQGSYQVCNRGNLCDAGTLFPGGELTLHLKNEQEQNPEDDAR